MSAPLIVIPARMASTRLFGKPLAEIGGIPMIVQVWQRAIEADIGPVLVACAEAEIAEAVTQAGGKAILTQPDLPSGSDRCHAAAECFDPEKSYETIINLQGDMPTLSPSVLHDLARVLDEKSECDIATSATVITKAEEVENPNIVKVAANIEQGELYGPALYFSRAAIPGAKDASSQEHLHHVGVYGWRRTALEKFVSLPVAAIEARESLEQLRALAAGMRIYVCITNSLPFGVDTQADLEKARSVLQAN